MIVHRLLRAYLPRTRSAVAVVMVSFVDSLGTGLYLAGATLFLIKFVGLGVAEVGLGLSIAGIASLVTAVPLGSLGDRIGSRRMLVAMQIARGLCFIGLAFVRTTPQYLLVSILIGASEGPISALNQAVVASVVEEAHRVHTLAVIRSARNVAFSLGALAASPLLLVGTAWAYESIMLLDAASFFAAALLLSRVELLRQTAVKTKASLARVVREFGDGNFVGLTLLNALFTIHMSILFVGVPIWSVSVGHIDPAAIPVLIAINTVLAVVLQVPVTKVSERPGGGLLAMRVGVACIVGSCLGLAAVAMLPLGAAIPAMVVSIILLTFGEVWQSAGEWELSFKFSPEDRRSLYLSVFSLGKSGQLILGPILVTAFLCQSGPVGWTAMGAVLLASVPMLGWVVRRLSTGPGGDSHGVALSPASPAN